MHYEIENEDRLVDYLNNQQPQMSVACEEKFEFLVISKRVLRSLIHHSRESSV